MPLQSIASYARVLRPALPAGVFAPSRWPLAWLLLHVSFFAAVTFAVVTGRLQWPALLLLSPLIGFGFGILSFVSHETLHGAVVRNQTLRQLIGWLGFLPFAVSPRLWVAWHNRVHHGHTNQVAIDPDTYPTLAQYEESSQVRTSVDMFSLGGRRWRGVFSLILGFSVQSATVLLTARKSLGMTRREHRLALAESALAVALWAGFAVLVGPLAFLLLFFVPVLVANVVVMGHILTNHNLSPHTDSNDPLVNSLSVTMAPVFEWLTMRFGYHVEHHLFPAMSSRHAPLVRDLLRSNWPERYQTMPIGRALLELHRTARVYKDDNTLIDPTTSREWPTLSPGVVIPAAIPSSDPNIVLSPAVVPTGA